MSIKVDMTSPDVDKQLELLKFYPEILKKHFRPRLYRAVGGLSKQIEPNIPRKTGRAAQTFGSRVRGTGINLMGQVGWYDRGDPWYPNVIEHGAKAHEMNTFTPGLGKYIKTHPGFSAIGFMAAGYSAYKGTIDQLMYEASEAVVNEMAVK